MPDKQSPPRHPRPPDARTGIPTPRADSTRPTTEQLAALAAPWRYTVRDGKKIGEHGGAHFYTIGQRKGLGIGGRKESLFILATDTVQNVIYVGEGDSHPGLWRQALHIAPREIHWVNPARTMPAGHSARFSVRIRYRQPLQEATLFVRDQGAYILFDPPAGHHTGAVRRMVRRRRTGRFGDNLGIVFPIPAPSEKRFQAPCRTGAAYIAAFPKHRFVFSQKANTYLLVAKGTQNHPHAVFAGATAEPR